MKALEKSRYDEYDENVYSRKDANSDELHECKRIDGYRFCDLKTREEFLLSSHEPVRINFFTYDGSYKDRVNELKPGAVEELDTNRKKYTMWYRRTRVFGTGAAGGILTGVFSFPLLSSFPLLGFVAIFTGYGGFAATSFLSNRYYTNRINTGRNKRMITFSNIEEEIRSFENVSVLEHQELRDMYNALANGDNLEIPAPQNGEFSRVCRKAQKRLEERQGQEQKIDPWALKLYSDKVENWKRNVRSPI